MTLGTAARNAAADAVVDLVDGGSGAGVLRLRAGETTLADITLNDPAFGAAVAGVATAIGDDGASPIGASNPLTGTAVGAGVADNYRVLDSAGTLIGSGLVTQTGATPAGEIVLDNTNIAVGQGVVVTAWTHTQPAS